MEIPLGKPHGKEVPFAIRSRPVGYAAEYLTLASDRHNMCRFWSMPMRILYHIWQLLGYLQGGELPNAVTFEISPNSLDFVGIFS